MHEIDIINHKSLRGAWVMACKTLSLKEGINIE